MFVRVPYLYAYIIYMCIRIGTLYYYILCVIIPIVFAHTHIMPLVFLFQFLPTRRLLTLSLIHFARARARYRKKKKRKKKPMTIMLLWYARNDFTRFILLLILSLLLINHSTRILLLLLLLCYLALVLVRVNRCAPSYSAGCRYIYHFLLLLLLLLILFCRACADVVQSRRRDRRRPALSVVRGKFLKDKKPGWRRARRRLIATGNWPEVAFFRICTGVRAVRPLRSTPLAFSSEFVL